MIGIQQQLRIAGLGLVLLGAGALALLGIGAATRLPWGDPARPVWYKGRLVPFGELIAQGIAPKRHDGAGPGVIACYDTNEELAAATGLDLPGTDPEKVRALRSAMGAGSMSTLPPCYVLVWYYGQLVPFEALLAQGIEPHCHDGQGPGVLTCYRTNEGLAAATGPKLPSARPEEAEALRRQGAVVPVACAYYAVVREHAYYGGRNFALCYDYNDFRAINFNDIASSIWIPSGAGASTYFEHINDGGDRRTFTARVPDLTAYGFNDRISSARRGR
jgi:hypothetical protein